MLNSKDMHMKRIATAIYQSDSGVAIHDAQNIAERIIEAIDSSSSWTNENPPKSDPSRLDIANKTLAAFISDLEFGFIQVEDIDPNIKQKLMSLLSN